MKGTLCNGLLIIRETSRLDNNDVIRGDCWDVTHLYKTSAAAHHQCDSPKSVTDEGGGTEGSGAAN